MKEFVEFLVKNVVKNPDSVAVTEVVEGTNFRYSVTVNPADMGLVIGKEGRTINSIRLLAKAKAVKEGVWVDVTLTDSGQLANA
ncbi:hypothetical protein COT50_03340 [candidate division WWE3 bacterium CG08_land_8_20_14_0_20_41_10]|uniref:RNA-binding protein KhpA n=1 Tax=candidate division WWE3 bacterium CG08_land_8_20_14_0_20_41_10 TaxID=1975085 RepID=A0A2H0XDH5_UNCKA|nr:MAG: hypothetical protein COT50_03340 [candidate division WWE3 bacterium CG08_land_8_20_14_0_20_41_10]